jgi:hypothetical protein
VKTPWRIAAGTALALTVTGLGGGTAARAVGGQPVTDAAYRPVATLAIGDPGGGDPGGGGAGGGGAGCTGTLVAPQWIITAKSCFGSAVTAGAPARPTTAVVGRLDPSGTAGSTATVTDVVPRADRDVLLAHLAAPVTGITPAVLDTVAPAAGTTLRVAGFGRTATEWVPDTLHASAFTVQAATAATLDIAGVDPAAGATCKGDAGGPAFRELGAGALALTALHSLSWQGGCLGSGSTRAGAVEARLDDLSGWLAQTTAAQPSKVRSYTTGDVDHDGLDDLVAIEPATGKLWMYPGTADSHRFGVRVELGRGGWNAMSQIAAGSFDAGTTDDLLAVDGAGVLWRYPGQADGTLGPRVEYGRSGWSVMTELTVGDLNRDGRDDLVALDGGTGKLWLYPGTAAGALGARVEIGTSGWSVMTELATADLNHDDRADVIALDGGTGKLWLYPGVGDGRLGARVEIGRSGWSVMTELAAGTFDQDTLPDLLAFDGKAGRLWLYPGLADGTLGGRLPMD